MQSFRVELHIHGPMVVSAHLIHLDDILASVAVERAIRAGAVDPYSHRTQLPLDKYETEATWCWKASAFWFEVMMEPKLVPRTSRLDYEHAANRRGREIEFQVKRFNIATGRYKAFDLRHEEQWVKTATAVGVGDLDRVEEMIGEVRQIGALRKLGYGRIRAFTVTTEGGGVPWTYRNMPATPETMTSVGGIRSPYWDRTQHEPIREPVVESTRA